ncbi:hypothetical protein F7U66_00315 [Vibrio parahaemolyticus]|nr:hypothetical protein [Vibrio parahaemolyticus]
MMTSKKSMPELMVDNVATVVVRDLYVNQMQELQSIFASMGYDSVPAPSADYVCMLKQHLEESILELVMGEEVEIGKCFYKLSDGTLNKREVLAPRRPFANKLWIKMDTLVQASLLHPISAREIQLTSDESEDLESFVNFMHMLDDVLLEGLGNGFKSTIDVLELGETPYLVPGCENDFVYCAKTNRDYADPERLSMVVFSESTAVFVESDKDKSGSTLLQFAQQITPYLK